MQSGNCPRQNGKWAVEDTCNQYVDCTSGVERLITCQNHLVYDEETGDCEHPDVADIAVIDSKVVEGRWPRRGARGAGPRHGCVRPDRVLEDVGAAHQPLRLHRRECELSLPAVSLSNGFGHHLRVQAYVGRCLRSCRVQWRHGC